MYNDPDAPLVSAVIPTRNRPLLVCRAVRSALDQTFGAIEVVVVVDGPDPETEKALNSIADSRLRMIALPNNVGGGEARNVGVRAAKGKYIALLDDDDEWLPAKIEKQLRSIVESRPTSTNILVACKYFARDNIAELILPVAIPHQEEDISEYLFCSDTVFGTRTGFLQTSTWLITRSYLLEVPFTKGLKRNQDTDRILRAMKVVPHALLIVDEPLAIFHNELSRPRIGTVTNAESGTWEYSYRWAADNRFLFTKRSLSYFLITICVGSALGQGQFWVALRMVSRDIREHGTVNVKLIAILMKYMCIWALPRSSFKRFLGRVLYLAATRHPGMKDRTGTH